MYICAYCNSNRVSFLARDLRRRSMCFFRQMPSPLLCRLSWSVRPIVGYCFLLLLVCRGKYVCLISFPYLEISYFSSFYFSKSILYDFKISSFLTCQILSILHKMFANTRWTISVYKTDQLPCNSTKEHIQRQPSL